MKRLVLLLFFLPFVLKAQDCRYISELDTLNEKEKSFLELISQYHQNFYEPAKVRRYYVVRNDKKELIKTVFVYEKQEGGYFGEYQKYEIIMYPGAEYLEYDFESGLNSRESGRVVNMSGNVVLMQDEIKGAEHNLKIYGNDKLLCEKGAGK